MTLPNDFPWFTSLTSLPSLDLISNCNPAFSWEKEVIFNDILFCETSCYCRSNKQWSIETYLAILSRFEVPIGEGSTLLLKTSSCKERSLHSSTFDELNGIADSQARLKGPGALDLFPQGGPLHTAGGEIFDFFNAGNKKLYILSLGALFWQVGGWARGPWNFQKVLLRSKRSIVRVEFFCRIRVRVGKADPIPSMVQIRAAKIEISVQLTLSPLTNYRTRALADLGTA
jgi:hypothetical protein